MPETDQPDPDDDDSSVETIISHDDSLEDIEEIMQYLDLCERGLVADTSPTQPPVPTHVGNNRRTLGEGFFSTSMMQQTGSLALLIRMNSTPLALKTKMFDRSDLSQRSIGILIRG